MRFEKVDYEFFKKDSINNGFEPTEDIFNKIPIPERKTAGAAAYDFVTPYDLELYPDERKIVPTGIKAQMGDGEMLLLTVRSSVGIRGGVVMSNTIGVIDSDFYSNPDDDGDIKLPLWNSSSKRVQYKAGDRIVQGFFINFLKVDGDSASAERTGGTGSTGA